MIKQKNHDNDDDIEDSLQSFNVIHSIQFVVK